MANDGLKLMSIRDVPPKATLESLPEEILLKIVKTAALADQESGFRYQTRDGREILCRGCRHGTCAYDHDFVANTVSEISVKFNRIARDGALWRDDKTMMVYIRHGSASICSLPDHLILKIIKFAAECKKTVYLDHTKLFPYAIEYDHDFVAQTIANVSHRFRRIASHPDLWKGNVSLDLDLNFTSLLETGADGLLNFFLQDATESFCFLRQYLEDEAQLKYLDEAIPEKYIRYIFDKCLNLNSLVFYETKLLSWPEMAPSRNTLEELYLSSCIIDTDLFKDINIGTILPNLKMFLLYQTRHKGLRKINGFICLWDEFLFSLHLRGGFWFFRHQIFAFWCSLFK